MIDTALMQKHLESFDMDGWLLYDFRGNNTLARRILMIDPARHSSRRWFYFVPREGEPVKIVHKIEAGALDHLPGEKKIYLEWGELADRIRETVSGHTNIAMEYSPNNAIPYISMVDAGTIELVRAAGATIVSSGDLVQLFEAVWTDAMWEMHREADKVTQAGFELGFGMIRDAVSGGGATTEVAVQSAIVEHFTKHGMVTDHPPIVAVGPHAGNPHYAPSPDADTKIRKGDFVLIDQWAKKDHPDGVFSDLTKVAWVGSEAPAKHREVFAVVAGARDAAIALVRERFAAGEPVRGFEVDRAASGVIRDAGYGEWIAHRTGHSIGRETHGNGANIDDLETHDERLILPSTCFSIEPGIYLEQFGIRSEVNVFVDAGGEVHVTGGLQSEILTLL